MNDLDKLRFKTLEDQIDETIIHGEYLQKKVKKKTWKDFWVVVKDNMMIFFHPNDGGWAGCIEITRGTTCTLILNGAHIGNGFVDLTLSTERAELNKRRKSTLSYKFALKTANGVHLFKASSETVCLEWVRVLRQVNFNEEHSCISRISENTQPEERSQRQSSKKSFMYKSFEPEVSENDPHEAQAEAKLSRSKSLKESRSPFKRSRFNSFHGLKSFRRYNSLQE